MAKGTEFIEGYERQAVDALTLGVNHHGADGAKVALVMATLAQTAALTRIGHFLEELLKMAKDSSCGHGTPTLFSPCVDCRKMEVR